MLIFILFTTLFLLSNYIDKAYCLFSFVFFVCFICFGFNVGLFCKTLNIARLMIYNIILFVVFSVLILFISYLWRVVLLSGLFCFYKL